MLKAKIGLFLVVSMFFLGSKQILAECQLNDAGGKAIFGGGESTCGGYVDGGDKKNIYTCTDNSWQPSKTCTGDCVDGYTDAFQSQHSNPKCPPCQTSDGKQHEPGVLACGQNIANDYNQNNPNALFKCSDGGEDWALVQSCGAGCEPGVALGNDAHCKDSCVDVTTGKVSIENQVCGDKVSGGNAKALYVCDGKGNWVQDPACPDKCQYNITTGNGASCGSADSTVKSEALDEKTYNPLCPSGNEINTALGCVPTEMNKFVPWLLKWLFGVAGGIAFLLMSYGFILIATSGGDEKKVQGARETITSAIVGLIVCIFSVFILQLIAVNILKIPGIN
jgi:hypothetical protein